jgi:hypothetical protein
MSLSDLSDLSELSSDEEDIPLVKSTQRATRTKKSKEYQITNTLRPPRTTQYTAKSLYDQIIENTIDLDPEYQRGVLFYLLMTLNKYSLPASYGDRYRWHKGMVIHSIEC